MDRRSTRKILAIGALALGLGLSPRGASAQLFGFGGPPAPPSGGAALNGASSTNSSTNLMMSNPYLNPLMNPYILGISGTGTNATPQANAQNAALYFMTMNQMNGGIGSGRISGVRGGPNNGSTKPAAPVVRGASNTPGAGASHYFNRSNPTSTSSARYYSRPSPYFPGNGH